MPPRHQLVRKDTLTEAQLADAIPAEFDEINLDLLVEMMLPAADGNSRTQLRMQLEDEMAAAMEKAMRGTQAGFLDLYVFIPVGLEPNGKAYKIRREPGPLIREMAENFVFVEIDSADIRPQPLIVRDKSTGTANELITKGGAIDIRGFDLSFDVGADDEGVYLVDSTNDAVEYRLAAAPPLPASNADALQEFGATVPANLPAGIYALQVRARVDGTNLVIGRLPTTLRADD